jgi:hypothetical protein
MNANGATKAWNSLCPPAQIYPIVMSALILFNLYRGTYRYAITHIVALVIGTTFLWVLCAARLEFAAYALLLLPVIFFVFLLALLFYDQSFFDIKRSHTPGCEPECGEEEVEERCETDEPRCD